ncbi:hypothetical protein [Acidovorax cavernicola]|uniref:hypothetical protein n=1 Tax=Acidovorax cavernicola TaxID=1675792 RepID=UPI0011C48D3F|nr:hypothetical protein [Acidovorax cavernicola]
MSKPWQNPTRTSGRPEAGRMLVRVSAVFTMVPGQKLPLSAVRGWKKDGLRRELLATVKSVYGDVNNRDNLFLSCCCF